MQIREFLEIIKQDKNYRRRIAHIEHIPSRKAKFASLREPLPSELQTALEKQGVRRLYKHQAEALEAARNGENFVVITSTASGKTLCYNLPVLEKLLSDPTARALYIFPTKALAQDQLGKLSMFPTTDILHTSTYDGDTPTSLRSRIRKGSRLVLTNPDMLHISILPYHAGWAQFFRNLKYVVVDEIHSYRGVFGSHVGNVLKRLRRIASHYGAEPQFLCASATIANPDEHFNKLTGLNARIISEDASPAGEKFFVFWNPPTLAKTQERRSANIEAAELFSNLVMSETRTILFTLARKTAELILRYAKSILEKNNSPAADRIMSYRAGYLSEERRDIEQKLFTGELLGVTSTTALELGVDVGELDASILVGYPGTIASTWQQAGRAGRSQKESLAVLIGLDDPINQFLMRNPRYFFDKTCERAIIDPSNPYILAQHLLCAAYEMPIENEEASLFGEQMFEVLAALCEAGEVSYRGRWFWAGNDYPAGQVSIRSTSGRGFDIIHIESGSLLGTADAAMAFETLHPGAVYLHAGESYVVMRLDIDNYVAYVSEADLDYYTVPSTSTRVENVAPFCSKNLASSKVWFGSVKVTSQVIGYRKKRLMSDQVMEYVPLSLPEEEFPTQAVWFAIPKDTADRLIGRGFDIAGSLHALEHAAIGILPLFAMCDRQDIGGVSNPSHPDVSMLPAVFIYDGHPGGVGIAEKAYEQVEELLEATLKVMEDCPCEDGCPSCVQSPKCGNNNQPLDKAGAIFMLRNMFSNSTKTYDTADSSDK